MSGPISIASASQWETLLKTHNVVVADFYADWCGPCKMIAPHFERLATQHSAPKKVAFCKVNVDTQSSVSRAHGVSAMPTFIIFHCGKAIKTIRGADPSALSAAISEAVKLKDQGVPGEYFKTAGHTLGGNTVAGGGLDFGSILNGIILFAGLYLFDAYKSAEASRFNVARPLSSAAPPKPMFGFGKPVGGTAPPKRTAASNFRTLADL